MYYRKPRNARSKRALEAREAKEVEDVRTAIFVKGTHTGEIVNGVMKELVCIVRKSSRLETDHQLDGTQTTRRNIVLEEKHRSPL